MKKTFTLAFSVWLGSLFSQSSPQTYTVPGSYTFTVPASVTTLTIEVIGGGGSGGGNGTGGGGGGGYAKGAYTVTPGSVLVVQVGAGGSGSTAGTTNVSTLLFATGGANGTTVPNPNVGGGGAGGVGSGGTIANYTGGTGGGGYYTYFGGGGGGAAGSVSNGTNGGNTIVYSSGNCQTPGGAAGIGGGAPAGNGGKGAGFTNSSCSATDPAAGGVSFGGGGGGGNGIGSTPGPGAGGYCQISWLSCALPAAPTNTTPSANQSLCAGNSTTLMVNGSPTLNWYSSPTSTTSLATGTAYTTPTLTAGTYTYYAASTNTCSEGPRTAVTVTVNPAPAMSVNSGSICSGQSFTFTPTGAVTYTFPGGASVVAPTQTVLPSVVAVYSITGTSAAGCIGSVTSSLTIYSLPVVNAASNPTLICAGQSATLSASGANTYTWSNGVTTPMAPVSPTITTSYSVTGRSNASGCSNSATVTTSVTICTGIENLAGNEPLLSIYPNPGKGDLTIASDREMKLLLTDNMGRTVKEISLQASNYYKAEISGLSNGIYFIISDSDRPIKQKIVVAK